VVTSGGRCEIPHSLPEKEKGCILYPSNTNNKIMNYVEAVFKSKYLMSRL
jgi:hypothetical protein